MSQTKRPLFREHALQHYMQRREMDILPRVISPPIFVFIWILLGLLAATASVAWFAQIPTFANGIGIVVAQSTTQSTQHNKKDMALVFFPASASQQLHKGLSGQVQISNNNKTIPAEIVQSVTGVMSPTDLQKHFSLSCNAVTQLLTQPSIAVEMQINSSQIVPGSPIHVQIQTGNQRVISLLPAVSQVSGG